jgi:TPR repeat protein
MRKLVSTSLVFLSGIFLLGQPTHAGFFDKLKKDLDGAAKGIEQQLQNQQRPPRTNQSSAQSARPTSTNGQGHIENIFLPRGSADACSEFSINTPSLTRQLLKAGYELDGPSPFRTIDDQSRRLESKIAEANTNADDNFNIEDEAGNCARGLAQLAKDNWDSYSQYRSKALKRERAAEEKRQADVVRRREEGKKAEKLAEKKRQAAEEKRQADVARRREERKKADAEQKRREADPQYAAKMDRLKLANSGDKDAMYQLGRLFEEGKGVELSLTSAAKWFYEAAKKGHLEAQYKMGDFYLDGRGGEKSERKAGIWLETAAKGGHKMAAKRLQALRKEKAEAEKRRKKEKAKAEKRRKAEAERIVRLKYEAKLELHDIAEYVKIGSDELQVMEIAKLYVPASPIAKGKWSKEIEARYNELLKAVYSTDEFKKFKKSQEMKRESMQRAKLEQHREKLSKFKGYSSDFVRNNLTSQLAPDFMRFSKMLSDGLEGADETELKKRSKKFVRFIQKNHLATQYNSWLNSTKKPVNKAFLIAKTITKRRKPDAKSRLFSKTRRLTCQSEKTGSISRFTLEKGGKLYMNGDFIARHLWSVKGNGITINPGIGKVFVNFIEKDASMSIYGTKTLLRCF